MRPMLGCLAILMALTSSSQAANINLCKERYAESYASCMVDYMFSRSTYRGYSLCMCLAMNRWCACSGACRLKKCAVD